MTDTVFAVRPLTPEQLTELTTLSEAVSATHKNAAEAKAAVGRWYENINPFSVGRPYKIDVVVVDGCAVFTRRMVDY